MEKAKAQGLSENEAGILASNAATRYLDMKFVQQNSYTRFKAQGMTNDEASQKSFEIIQDKYSDWISNIS